MRLTAALGGAWLLVGASACLVQDDGSARVRVEIDLGVLELPAESLPGPRDEDGLVHLDRVPAYVQVEVTGPGLESRIVASWPDREPLTPRAVVRFALDLPVGPQRRFCFLAYVRRSGEVRTWSDDGTVVVDLLEGGVESELAVTLHERPRGTIAGSLEGPASGSVVAVRVVDGDPLSAGSPQGPGVAWPPAEVTAAAFTAGDLPVGRPLSFRLQREDGSSVLSPTPPVTLSEAGQRLEVTIEAP